nr:ribonuclease inhibitor-like [Nerophis lumbriciformis]
MAIQKSPTIFTMCHIPIFSWITTRVIQGYLDKDEEGELPITLTEICTVLLSYNLERFKERLPSESIHYMKVLAELAFHHTMKKHQIFYEEDLKKSGFDYRQAAKHCGLFTEVFNEVRQVRKQQGKMFQFIHLTIQEYLAALYVMISLFHDKKNILAYLELSLEGVFMPITQVHELAIQKAWENEGNLDLFLRFLIGLSLQCNQKIVRELLKPPENCCQSNLDTVRFIKHCMAFKSPEENINLFYCLNELNDNSLLKRIQQKLSKGNLNWRNKPVVMWSALAFFLLTSDEAMNSFDLQKYSATAVGLEMLQSVVKGSQKSFCHLLASILNSRSNLRHLDLSNNNLLDEGVEILLEGLASPHCILQSVTLQDHRGRMRFIDRGSQVKPLPSQALHLNHNNLRDGVLILLASPHCILHVLELIDCRITKKGCVSLAQALKSNLSQLQTMDLSGNVLMDEGVETLSKALASPECNLQDLMLKHCRITKEGCVSLAEALKLNPSRLQKLDLSNNVLMDEGIEKLSIGLARPDCILQDLKLSHCSITKKGCFSLAEALKSNPSHLQKMDLTGNDLMDEGIELLSAGLASPDCIFKILRLPYCKIMKQGCVALAEALKLNPSHLQELELSYINLRDGVLSLSAALASPLCNLRILGLSSCGIMEKECVSLGKALKLNPSHLQELNLSYNKLRDGVLILSAGLASPDCTIQVLELTDCRITEKGCVSLGEAFKSKPYNLQSSLNRSDAPSAHLLLACKHALLRVSKYK